MDFFLGVLVIGLIGGGILKGISFLLGLLDFDSDRRNLTYTYAILGGLFFLYCRCDISFGFCPKIDQFLQFRSPLSKFLIWISNFVAGKITKSPTDNSLIDLFFTPYRYVDTTFTSYLKAIGCWLLLTVASVYELALIYIVYFPEVYLIPKIILWLIDLKQHRYRPSLFERISDALYWPCHKIGMFFSWPARVASKLFKRIQNRVLGPYWPLPESEKPEPDLPCENILLAGAFRDDLYEIMHRTTNVAHR